MFRRQPFLLCLLCVACVVVAGTTNLIAAQDKPRPVAAKPAKQVLEPGQIDTDRSRSFVFVGKSRLGHEHAVEGKVKSGQVRLGATRDAGEIVFDMASFQADTPKARQYIGLEGDTAAATQRKVTANLLGADVLDVARHPTATFAITSATPVEQSRGVTQSQYTLEGKFTLHGVTRPLRVVAAADRSGSRVRLRGNFTIRQSDFGITPYSTGLGAIGVADELAVHGEIWIGADQVRR